MSESVGFNLTNEMKKYTLSDDETEKLYSIIINGTPEEQEKAREKLAEGNLQLSTLVIQRFGIKYNMEDYFQEGCMGIWEAAKKFNPEIRSKYTNGMVKFDSYAYWWAQARIVRALADKSSQCRIPANKKSDFIMVKKALEEISKNTECSEVENLSPEEIAEFMNSDRFIIFRKNGILGQSANKRKYSVKVVKEALECAETLSLDATIAKDNNSEDADTSAYNFIESDENMVDSVQTEILNNQLWDILKRNCTEKELAVLHGISEDKSYADIGRELNVSREYIRKIFNKLKSNLSTNVEILDIKNFI